MTRRLPSPAWINASLWAALCLRHVRLFVRVTGAVFLLPLTVFALDPAKSIFQFNCQNWSRQNGLPADNISAVTQTQDGFIWLGTQNGLVRFDGRDFTAIPIALPAAKGQNVGKLQAARDGGLWFSIVSGGFGFFDGHAFSAIDDPRWSQEGMAANTVLESGDGAIWTGSVMGLGRWVKHRPEETFLEEIPHSVLLLSEDQKGRIWVGTAEYGLRYREKNQWTAIGDEELLKLNIYSVVTAADGDIWVGTNRGLRRYNAGGEFKATFLPAHLINALLIDRHGVLWVATSGDGLARFHNEQFQFLRKADGLGGDFITSLFEDAEGSLWAGTQDGLSQLTDLKFPIYSSAEGIKGGSTHTVSASRRGGLWISAADGFSYFDGRHATYYNDPALQPNAYSRRSFEARNGDVYIGDGEKNINVIAEGRLVRRYSPDTWAEAFAEDSESVLIGLGPALVRARDGELQPFPFIGEPPSFGWINNLCVGRNGVIWLATNNGIFRIEHGRAQRWSTQHGLSSDRVHFILEDIDGAIWAGLPTELLRLKGGRVENITVDHGLFDNRIYAIVPDDHGFFWIASGRGFFRVSRDNLNDFADKKIRRIECEAFDGLESVKVVDRTGQGYSGCKTSDGRIWFPNPRGVVMIDPRNFFVNRVAPPVNILRVHAEGNDYSPRQPALLAVGEDRIEFHFAALSYISPRKVQVRYQLEGLDSTWIDAGDRRTATYSHLKPGHYRFNVQARNADGIWNTAGDQFAFQLPPPFYSTLWFYGLCGLAVGGSLFGGFRWKVRHMQAQQRRLRAQNDLLEEKVSQRTDELANSLSLLKATLDSTTDGILAVQFSGGVVNCNTQFIAMWKLPPDALTSDAAIRDATMVQVRDPEAFLARINEVHAHPETEAFDVIDFKDGRIVERYCKPQRIDGKIVGIVINFRDVTERRRAEEALRTSESFLHSLVENLPVHIFRKDRAGRITFANRRYCERHNLPLPEILGKTAFDFRHRAEAERIARDDEAIMVTGKVYESTEEQTIRSGELRYIQIIKVPIYDAAGQCAGLQGMFLDVTEAKLAEGRLVEASSLLEAMLSNSPDSIYFKDRESRFVRVSKPLLARFGALSVMRTQTDFDLFAEEHARKAFNDEQEIMRTGLPLLDMLEKEVHLDGRITWALTTKLPWRNPDGVIVGTFGISKDITPLKEAEAKLAEVHRQLLETSRQAGMAEVATGVLHNVGNVLNSVNVSANLIVDQVHGSKTPHLGKIAAMLDAHPSDLGSFLTEDPKGRRIPAYLGTLASELAAEQHTIVEELGHLRKNIEHIKEVVAMQQSYAKVSGVLETVPIVELVEDALRMNSGAFARHGLEVVRDFQAEPVVTIERHKVLQILVNLIRNSKYACDDQGRPDKRIIVRIAVQQGRVKISVMDNGIGIPRENLTRIFAHGFTTRKEGHGFGLHSGALAAREMGGSLHAHSDGLGCGATFTLEFPLPTPASSS